MSEFSVSSVRKPLMYFHRDEVGVKEEDFLFWYGFYYRCTSAGKFEPLRFLGKALCIPKRETTKDALDYYSEVIKHCENNCVPVLVYLSFGDATIKHLSEYNYSRIQTIRIRDSYLELTIDERCFPIIILRCALEEVSLNYLVDRMFEPFVTSMVVADPNATPRQFFRFVENVHVHIDKYSKTYRIGEICVTPNEQEVMWFITGPASLVRDIVFEMEKFFHGKEITRSFPGTQIDSFSLKILPSFANIYQSKDRHRTIVDVCIALFYLELPKYVLLEIIDWLPYMQYHLHRKKIDLIFAVYESCDKVINAR